MESEKMEAANNEVIFHMHHMLVLEFTVDSVISYCHTTPTILYQCRFPRLVQ